MRLLGSLVVISVCSFSADGVRLKRAQKTAALKGAKFLAGVPILNYHLSASKTAGVGDEEWMLAVKPEITDEQVHAMCSKLKCVREGHPSKGGVAYFEVKSTEAQLETLLSADGSMIKFVERDGEVRNVPDIHEVTSSSSASWGLDRVGAPTRSTTGNGVHVYVLDTGLRTSHQDFGGRATSSVDMSNEGRHTITSAGIANDGASATYSGTSMACPHVSGGVALLLENSPGLSPDEVLERLIDDSVRDAVKDLKCGDVNFLLHVGAGIPPVTDAPQPAPVCTTPTPPLVCSDGCVVKAAFINDGWCDCSDCGDEVDGTCEDCGGCPTTCGEYTKCR